MITECFGAGLLAWLALDLGEARWRQSMHDIALSLTTEAEDRMLGAYVQGFRSQVRQFEGRPHAALALAHEAVATAGSGQSASVHAWLRNQAVGLGLPEVQDQRGSMDALSALEAALAGGSADEPAWMYQFDDVRLTAVRGDCLLGLDQPAHAEKVFQQALTGRNTGVSCAEIRERTRHPLVSRVNVSRIQNQSVCGTHHVAPRESAEWMRAHESGSRDRGSIGAHR